MLLLLQAVLPALQCTRQWLLPVNHINPKLATLWLCTLFVRRPVAQAAAATRVAPLLLSESTAILL